MTNEPTEMPDTRRRTRAEITADFDAGTATIREWVGGCAVHGPRLCEELAAWLDYWGGSPFVPALPEVPDGHELVVLPCDVVDVWASDGVPGSRRAVILLDACRAAVARRPKPAPKTERVHWSEAVGRKDPHDGTITMIGVPRIYVGQDSWMDVTDPDGMVEVLVEVES